MNGRESRSSPAVEVGRNVADLTHDLLSLAELQCQLMAVDAREALSRSLLSLGLMLVSLLLVLGTLPVALLGTGWILVNFAGLGEGAAFLIVSLAAVVIAAGLCWWGFHRLKAALHVMTRSRYELSENVRWVKEALKQHGTRSHPHQRV